MTWSYIVVQLLVSVRWLATGKRNAAAFRVDAVDTRYTAKDGTEKVGAYERPFGDGAHCTGRRRQFDYFSVISSGP